MKRSKPLNGLLLVLLFYNDEVKGRTYIIGSDGTSRVSRDELELHVNLPKEILIHDVYHIGIQIVYQN